MSARRYLAWRMVEEATEADRRHEERQRLARRRVYLTPHFITDTHFVQRFRLNKAAFEYLRSTLQIESDLKSSQRVSLDTKMLCALLFYANGDYQRVVGLANHLSQEAVCCYIEQVTEALNHPNVVKKFIKFPSTREEREQIKQRFQSLYGIPGVIGCVDGSHFRIFKPHKNMEHLFYCRKHYHSLNVQIVADYECRILAINPKFGGATHDAFIWENSRINTFMQYLHRQRELVWLLGDSGYPQRPWLMTPYRDPTPGSAAYHYNLVHSRARVVVENTLGILKNRWRCLCKDRVLHYKPEKCARIITACCVLHNIALDFRIPTPQDPLPVTEEFHRIEIPDQENDSLLTMGRLMRDRVAQSIHSQAA